MPKPPQRPPSRATCMYCATPVLALAQACASVWYQRGIPEMGMRNVMRSWVGKANMVSGAE